MYVCGTLNMRIHHSNNSILDILFDNLRSMNFLGLRISILNIKFYIFTKMKTLKIFSHYWNLTSLSPSLPPFSAYTEPPEGHQDQLHHHPPGPRPASVERSV